VVLEKTICSIFETRRSLEKALKLKRHGKLTKRILYQRPQVVSVKTICSIFKIKRFLLKAHNRTKSFLESSGCRTRPLKPADINPSSLKWVKIRKKFSSELMVQIKQKSVYGVENPRPNSFLGGLKSHGTLTKLILYQRPQVVSEKKGMAS